MRELTSLEINAIAGGVEGEIEGLQSKFWGSFMYSSGFASGIFWSPVMPFIMGGAALISIIGSGLVSLVSTVGNGIYIAGNGAVSYIKN